MKELLKNDEIHAVDFLNVECCIDRNSQIFYYKFHRVVYI